MAKPILPEGYIDNRYSHGHTYSPEYVIWVQMKARCYTRSHSSYCNYGAKGVIVCERWRTSFVNFLIDVGPRPSDKHSLGRERDQGNYEPGNAGWQTLSEQIKNRK